MTAPVRATTPESADEALAWLREQARLNAGLGVQLTDGRVLFGSPEPGDFPSLEPQQVEAATP